MAPERWEKIKHVLEECLERRPEERSAFLDSVCAGDEELRREVESLTRSYEESEDLLEEPAMGRAEAPEDMEGRRVGPYRIVREIGEGGMARVFLAVRADDAFRRQVAVKLVKRGMDFDFILRRFRNERQILAGLEHPHVARLFDAGTCEDGTPYFVMEYIQGRPIDEHCDANTLSIPERLEIFRTVCSAVQHAHEHGVVHRDIKPGNILITPAGVPKLLDFGIAKMLNPEDWTGVSLTRTATILRMMTPEYASPEQVRGDEVSAATDVYSLGVLLYELLTGHRPYRMPNRAPHEMARAICDSEPERPSSAVGRVEAVTRTPFDEPRMVTPERVGETRRTRPDKLRRSLRGDLDNIVLMAMRKEPGRRYESVAALAEDIRRYTAGMPVKARRDTLVYRTHKLLERNRAAVAASAAGLAVAAALGVAALRWMPGRESGFLAGAAVSPFTTFQGTEKQPVFSPDGRSIAFVWGGEKDENYDIYIKPVEGGELQRVTTDMAEDLSPVFSPDGRSIAWLRIKNDKVLRETGVFVLNLKDGGVHRKITDVSPNRVEAVGRHLDWSPDGAWLAVADKPDPDQPYAIYEVRVLGPGKWKVTNPPKGSIGDTNPAFSPDGRSLSFLRAPSSGITELYVMRLDSGEARRVTFDSRVILGQTWTADGKSLIFSSNRTGGFCLWQVPAEGGTPRRLPGSGEGASEPSVSRDGKRLVYSQFLQDANIWRLDLSTKGEPRMLISSTQYDSSPAYSPDGTKIAFRSQRTGFHELWVSDSEGRNARQMTYYSGPLTGSPRWSPDGKLIAFDSRPEGQAEIFVIPAEGGTPRRITYSTSEDVVPRWSRDGQWIYFASNRTGTFQVWKTPLAGGAPVQVTQNGGFAPVESPGGRWLYYVRGRGVAGLYRMPVEGGPEEPVLEQLKPGFWGYWVLDVEAIYFADFAKAVGGDLFRFRLRDRAIEHLRYIERPFTIADGGMALSPDGRSLLYTEIDQSGSDIMLMDAGRR